MTYCVAIKLDAGLVFLADSRTNAGLDHISSFRKMMVYESPGDRFMVLLSAGNLSISQSVREILQLQQLRDEHTGEMLTIWNVRSMFDAARILGAAVRHVYDRDGVALKRAGLDFNVSLVLGGQIRGEGMRLFQVYSAGNFIEATEDTPFFQIGEHKYGKPILDRIITRDTTLEDATKAVLVSMDSTLRSNLSVGMPVDMALLRSGDLKISQKMRLEADTPLYAEIHDTWSRKLEAAVHSLPRFPWEPPQEREDVPGPLPAMPPRRIPSRQDPGDAQGQQQ